MAETFDPSDLNFSEDSEIRRLLETCPDIRPRLFREGEYLAREGDESMETFLVLEGGFVVERPDEETGQPQMVACVVCSLEEPAFVGEMAYFGGGFRTASIRGSGLTRALCLEPKHLDTVIEKFPFFTRVLCRQFTNRLTEANDLIQTLQDRFMIDAEQVFLKPGDPLCEKGTRADRLFQLLQGELGAREDEALAITPLAYWRGIVEPSLFFTNDDWPWSLVARKPSLVVVMNEDSKQEIVRNFPRAIIGLIEKIGRKD